MTKSGDNALYYGDNLDVLREYIADESVDLVYLDPPFNSNAQYNVLFRDPDGKVAEAQAEAFHDTWHWGEHAEAAYAGVLASGSPAAGILRALRGFLGESDMMAYLAMMAERLRELRRVLKPTGTLYLHCDPTASHYLKILLDGICGDARFQNEIIWQRTNTKGHAYTRFPTAHDVILAYRMDGQATWNRLYAAHSEKYIKSHYSKVEEESGRRYTLDNCLNPNPNRPNLTYEWNGHLRVWRWTRDKMQMLHEEGRLVYTKSGMTRYKRYLDEMKGTPVTDMWTDIFPVNSQARERIGYPTQKPLALMERIISASSNPGDVVLDPFCGCGTTVHAAQALGRRWIGIDVTHYAITVIESRLKAAFPALGDFPIVGRPRDLEGARELARRDKYQFQWWANWLVGVQTYRDGKKGADRGIDGTIFFMNGPRGTGRVLVSVKAGDNVGVAMIRDFRGTLEREEAELGLFVSLSPPTSKMKAEAAAAGIVKTAHGAFPRLQILTVSELLEGRRPNIPPAFKVEADRRPRSAAKTKKSPQMEFSFLLQGGRGEGRKTPAATVHLDPVLQLQLSTVD